MVRSGRIAVVVAAALLAVPLAHAAKPADVISKRQANFKAIGRAFKATRDELQKDAPAIAVLRANADALDKAARQIPRHFPRGTGPEAGVKTAALPAIWAAGSTFNSTAASFQKLSGDLRAATASGDMARIKAATGALGGGCKSCHDNFKAKD